MSKELKPCPFCGGEVFAYESDFIRCDKCDLWVDATFKWNTRPIEDALQSELQAEQEKVCKLREALGEAYIILAALDLSVTWELANEIKSEIKRVKEIIQKET